MKSKRKLNKIARLLLIVLSTLVFVFFFYISLKKSYLLDKIIPLYYSETSFLDYKVCLKENTDYDVQCLDKNMNYIASLIDYLEVDFNYTYEIDEKVEANYDYYVDAKIKVYDKTNPSKIIKTETIRIVDSKSFTASDTKKFDISEKVKINYSEYNDRIRAFKANYNLVAASDVTLVLNVENSSTNEKYEKPIKNTAVMSVIIPLTENRIDITMNHKDINNQVIINSDDKIEINRLFAGLTAIFALGVVSNIIVFIYYLFQPKVKKTAYEKYITKILREYDDIITEAVTLIDETAYDIYDIKTFGELKNISDRLERPIIFTEDILDNGIMQAWFSLIDDGVLYRIVVRSNELD